MDPLTLLAVLGSIIGLTVWLRQAIIDNVKMGRKKREIHSPPQICNLLQSNPNEPNQIKEHCEMSVKSIVILGLRETTSQFQGYSG